MELSYIWVLMVVVVIAVLGWKWRQKSAHAHNKGEQGEAMLRQHTDPSLADKGYHALHDLLIPLYESTTQIDHLYVSRYGIFVVETKIMQVGFMAMPNKNNGRKYCINKNTVFIIL